MSIVRAPRPESGFSSLRNDVLRDKRLSYRASGVLDDILSRPDNWQTSAEALVRARRQEGREAIRTALKELQAAGYLVHEKIRDPETGQIRTVSYVYDEPRPTVDDEFLKRRATRRKPPAPKKPASGNPTSGNPAAGESGPLRSTDKKDCQEELLRTSSSCAPSSSSSPKPTQPTEDDDDARKTDQLAARREAKAHGTRLTRKQREERQARSLIVDHATNNFDSATALLTAFDEDGIKYPGAYLAGVIEQDGEDKIADLVEDAETRYAVWLSEQEEKRLKAASGIAEQLRNLRPKLKPDALARIRDAYAEARRRGWDSNRLDQIVNEVLHSPRGNDADGYAEALAKLGVRIAA